MRAKDLLKLIPSHVRATKDITYEVLWCEEFLNDSKQIGACDPTTKQIKLKTNESPTETYSTFIHECIHMIALENDINVTENQVLALEKGLFRVLKLNGILEKL